MISTKAKGYIIGAVAAASYGTNPLFALPLYSEGMTPDSVLLFRYILAIPLMGLMLMMRRGGDHFHINIKQAGQLFIMGILMALSSLTLFMSYTYMDAGIASTLLFVYPIMVAVIMAIGFKEKIRISTILCILMALSGIGLLFKKTDGSTISLFGTLLVMVSSLTYAIYIVGINQTRLRFMATLKVIFYVLIFGSVVFIIKIFAGSEFTAPSTALSWLNLLGLAIFPTAISFLCTTTSIQLIGPTPTAILGALEPVTAVAIGVLLFGEELTLRSVIGMILILAAVSLVIGGGNVHRKILHIHRLFPRRKK